MKRTVSKDPIFIDASMGTIVDPVKRKLAQAINKGSKIRRGYSLYLRSYLKVFI